VTTILTLYVTHLTVHTFSEMRWHYFITRIETDVCDSPPYKPNLTRTLYRELAVLYTVGLLISVSSVYVIVLSVFLVGNQFIYRFENSHYSQSYSRAHVTH